MAAEVCPATDGDAQTLADSVMQAQEKLTAIESGRQIEEVAADKGNHSAAALELCQYLNLRTYFHEPKRNGDWNWTTRSAEHERAVRNNRRRMQRSKGRLLQRLRSEPVERSFAHVSDSGGTRRSWLRGLTEVTKRYVIATATHNLGRVFWKLLGVGKPRGMQGRGGLWAASSAVLSLLCERLDQSLMPRCRPHGRAPDASPISALAR